MITTIRMIFPPAFGGSLRFFHAVRTSPETELEFNFYHFCFACLPGLSLTRFPQTSSKLTHLSVQLHTRKKHHREREVTFLFSEIWSRCMEFSLQFWNPGRVAPSITYYLPTGRWLPFEFLDRIEHWRDTKQVQLTFSPFLFSGEFLVRFVVVTIRFALHSYFNRSTPWDPTNLPGPWAGQPSML